MKIIEVNNLSFAYQVNQSVLKNINFTIDANKFVALIGPNGAGKSTLFKILLGNIKLDSCDIKFFGDPLASANHNKEIAYISQYSILAYQDFPTTVYELLSIHLKFLKSKVKVEYYLEMMDLKERSHHRLNELSGGQLQRVALAIAILKEPKLIILDEPTSGIDKKFSHELFDLLSKLSKKGISILMATHNLAVAKDYVDEILCLEDGSISKLSASEIERELSNRHDHRNY